MRKVLLVATLLASVLGGLPRGGARARQERAGPGEGAVRESAVKVKITTGGGLYGPPKTQYKVGEEIPVVISLTNTTDGTLTYCRSTSVFQNRPELKRDGQLVPYLTNLTKQADEADFIQRCEASAARQLYSLQPKKTRVVDWFSLNRGSLDWYGPLPAGRYELLLRRRLACCQGLLLESDTITFEIKP